MLTKLNKLKTLGINLTIITLLLLSTILLIPTTRAQGPFTIDLTITGASAKFGVATVTGTVTCS